MKSINLQKTESLLRELIPEALSTLNDENINSLTILDVDCKNGKYDADVYFDGSDFSKEEKKVVVQKLNKAGGAIKSYCLSATGWYKCPNFKFMPDDNLESQNRLEELFEKIKR